MIKNGYRSTNTRDDFLSLKKGDTVIVYDTETTGLSVSKGDRILEFSAEKFLVEEDYGLKLIDNIQLYINPQFPIPPKVTEIHGITDEFISDKPTEAQVFDKIFEWMNDAIVCGHNVSFDNRFIADMFERHGEEFNPAQVLDTLQAARDLVDAKSVPDNKLATIAKLYGCDEGMTFHTAKDDVHVCGKLLQVFLDEYREKSIMISRKQRRKCSLRLNQGNRNSRKSFLTLRGCVFRFITTQITTGCIFTPTAEAFGGIDITNVGAITRKS